MCESRMCYNVCVGVSHGDIPDAGVVVEVRADFGHLLQVGHVPDVQAVVHIHHRQLQQTNNSKQQHITPPLPQTQRPNYLVVSDHHGNNIGEYNTLDLLTVKITRHYQGCTNLRFAIRIYIYVYIERTYVRHNSSAGAY